MSAEKVIMSADKGAEVTMSMRQRRVAMSRVYDIEIRVVQLSMELPYLVQLDIRLV